MGIVAIGGVGWRELVCEKPQSFLNGFRIKLRIDLAFVDAFEWAVSDYMDVCFGSILLKKSVSFRFICTEPQKRPIQELLREIWRSSASATIQIATSDTHFRW